MKPPLWRAIALTLIAAAAIFVVISPAFEVPRGDFGFSVTFRNGAPVVTRVAPHSSASAAGIRPGDRIRLLHETFWNHAREGAPPNGTRVQYVINGSRTVTLTASGGTPASLFVFGIIRLAFLIVAALLAVRRSEDRAVRSLVVFLACFGLGMALSNNAFKQPILSLLVLAYAGTALITAGCGAAVDFAATFPNGRASGFAAVVRNIAVGWVVAALAIFTAVDIFPTGAALTQVAIPFVPGAFVFAILATIALLILGHRGATGAERQRRLWLLGVIAAGLVGPAISIATFAILGYFIPILDQFASLTAVVIPVGLAYVILRHRVIDVGFVLNRAVVYTLLSAFVVGIFVVLETLLGKYVEQTSHVTSVSVELAVALVLGFSIRFIHERVDRFVDRTFFHRRHQAETALREFTHDAPYITERSVLLRRSVDSVVEYAEAGAAGIWMRDGGRFTAGVTTFGPCADVDENDPAILAMRARSAVVDLNESRSALPGVIAFPMTVRGELLGVLACEAKRDGTGYAPDEREALAALAASVGHALDGLEVRALRQRLSAFETLSPATGGVASAL